MRAVLVIAGVLAAASLAAAAPLPTDVPQHLYEDCAAQFGETVGLACFAAYLVAVHACAIAAFSGLGDNVPAEVWAVCFAP